MTMPHAVITAIEYAVPEKKLTTAGLAADFPDWAVEKIDAKTGIECRHIAADGECASDLAVDAAKKLFASGAVAPEAIDYILLCTQTPDYLLPTTACLLQHRLGIPMSAGAFDFNLGSSGYIYGLGLAQGLIATGQAQNILLITADTYSKLIHPRDKSVRTLFGDAAAVSLVQAAETGKPHLGPFVYGTDGAGGENLIVPAGGMRIPRTPATAVETEDQSGNIRTPDNLYMNGGEIFHFTLSVVPKCIDDLLEKSRISLEDVDLFIFHQANKYMLDHIRKRLHIPEQKFYMALSEFGNTVSCTIPLALRGAMADGRVPPGSTVMLVGFGVGYSWGATFLRP